MKRFDVAIIGGGIIGTSAAAFLAEAGRSVVLYERDEIAAAASGRNSGVIQHPFDPVFATLYRESLDLYRQLAAEDDDFRLPDQPAGILLLTHGGDAAASAAETISDEAPDLAAALVDPDALMRLEPSLADGLWACRLETGYPVAPSTATHAWARRARRAGVEIVLGVGARVDVAAHDQTLIAAGPWSVALVPGWDVARPITPVWGVVTSTTLVSPPKHVLEEMGISRSGEAQEREFSLVTADERSSVGSTFIPAAAPVDASAIAPELMERGARFVPEIGHARVEAVRSCARPVSFDGRPLIGAVDDARRIFVCAGHGPWGISTGPASALAVVRAMLGQADVRPEFAASRVARVTDGPVGANTEFA